MARDRQSIVKMSRREGYALHPKAHKALVKRTNKPGQSQNMRGMRGGGKTSQYSLQLREKQKVKRLYGLLEKQFSNLMKQATAQQGASGPALLQMLEQRADNAVYRAGFAPSRRAARQLMTHGHFMLNDVRIDIPSIKLKPGDVMIARPHSLKTDYFKRLDDVSPSPTDIPGWLKVDRKKFTFSVTGVPTRDDSEPDINEQLIVEYYSR
jgi:small subunit ribosomal protein S4